jgi:hypothetical protein
LPRRLVSAEKTKKAKPAKPAELAKLHRGFNTVYGKVCPAESVSCRRFGTEKAALEFSSQYETYHNLLEAKSRSWKVPTFQCFLFGIFHFVNVSSAAPSSSGQR